MANLKAVKRKMSKWGVLGNAFLSVVLAVSLMPSYAAFGDDGQVNNDTSAWQSADVQAQNCESDAVDTDSVNGPAMAYDGFDESGSGAEPYAVELTAMGMLGANTVKISVPAADAGDELRAALGSAPRRWTRGLPTTRPTSPAMPLRGQIRRGRRVRGLLPKIVSGARRSSCPPARRGRADLRAPDRGRRRDSFMNPAACPPR